MPTIESTSSLVWMPVIGAFSLRNNPFDMWLAIGFGILGYVFRVAESTPAS